MSEHGLPKEQKEEMLIAAMKEAVKIGMFPQHEVTGTYPKHWKWMERCLDAALSEIVDTNDTKGEI